MPAATIAKRARPNFDHAHRAVLGFVVGGGRRLDSDHWTLRRYRTLCGSSRARAGGRRRAGVWCGVDGAEHRAAPLPSARERAVGIYHARFTRGLRRGPVPCDTPARNPRRTSGASVGGSSVRSSRGLPATSPTAGIGPAMHPRSPHDQAHRSCRCPHRRHGGVLADRDAQPHDRAAPVDATGFSPGRVAVVLLRTNAANRNDPRGSGPGGRSSVRINAMRRRRL